MSNISENIMRSITETTNVPIVLRQFANEWPICHWSLEQWCSAFGDRQMPFRTLKRSTVSEEPCWERKCGVKTMTFEEFTKQLDSSEEWMYFDYKYMHQWFAADDIILKEISWKAFGYPDKSGKDSTLWVGSGGAHTPAHQDTYGINIVTQLHGKKRWLLFPPNTAGLKPTRVPYEESSVYSELNFYCPADIEAFKPLTGGLVVELSVGDALVVPHGWWHYVQNLDSLNIAVNTWISHAQDMSARVSEALIKVVVAQICKDLPHDTRQILINPNEDDISDTPLAVQFLQLETVAKAYLDRRRKTRRAKRQKTREEDPASGSTEYNLNTLIDNAANRLELARPIDNDDIMRFLEGNLKQYASVEEASDDAVDCDSSTACLTKAIINSFSDSNVIEQVFHVIMSSKDEAMSGETHLSILSFMNKANEDRNKSDITGNKTYISKSVFSSVLKTDKED